MAYCKCFGPHKRKNWGFGAENSALILCFLGELAFLGRRQAAGELSLFAAKKRRKNRHRFEAVDADQGCGPGPGVCGHLTTAYSGPGGPEQGMDLKSLRESNGFFPQSSICREMALNHFPCSPGPSPVNRPSLGGRISGSGAAAPAGGRRIGTAGPFRFLFGHEKEGLIGRMPSAK